jgi:hypothetical protein
MIQVKIIELGKETREFCLDDNSTVSSLLRAAEITDTNISITRRGCAVIGETTLFNNDSICIGKMMKGNLDPFNVEFLRLGGTSVSVGVDDGYTIKRAIDSMSSENRAQFIQPDGKMAYEFRVNGSQLVDENYVLIRPAAGSVRIICSQRMKGNE